MRNFVKVALRGEPLQNLDIAIRRLEEVEQSLRLVGFTTHMNQATPSYVHNPYAIRRALEEVLSGKLLSASTELKPCSALILWMAVLEQKAAKNYSIASGQLQRGTLVHHCRVAASADDRPESQADCLNEVTRAAVLNECPPSRLWLKAAIQMILEGSGRVSQDVAELRHRAKRLFGFFAEWGGIQLQGREAAQVQSALGLAFQTCDTSDQVWLVAATFLEAQNAHLWGAICAQVALEEALTRSGRGCMDWEDVADKLPLLLDKLGDASREQQLWKDLESIIKQHWVLRGLRWPNRIPGFAHSISAVILAKALTADPDTASHADFEDNSELAWLRLAASVGYQAHVPASAQRNYST